MSWLCPGFQSAVINRRDETLIDSKVNEGAVSEQQSAFSLGILKTIYMSSLSIL